jgi:hypothetical protein
MDQATEKWDFREGAEVFGSDGDKVGRIFEVYPTYIVVEKGYFFPTDYFIPKYAIARYDGHRAYLNVTKGDALHHGWDQEPEKPSTEPDVEEFDASGTAKYAAAREELTTNKDATAADAAAGLTDHMGESATSPGLAGDLTQDRPEAASSVSNDPDETVPPRA